MSADADSVDELAEVRAVQDRATAPSSKNTYTGKILLFLEYLGKEKPELLAPPFFETIRPALVGNSVRIRPLVIGYLNHCQRHRDQYPFPLNDGFTVDDFMAYLLVCKKKNISASTLNGICSGIRHLFVMYDRQAQWAEYSPALALFKRGAKNDIAKAKQSGRIKVREGKEPLPFALYVLFCQTMLESADPEAIFARLFLILSWNLMCRSKNTAEICMSHMRWIQDALGIVFGQQKNDQEGEDKDYRHVYANPLNPAICPILALAIYLLCLAPFSENSEGRLFPGSEQAKRFGNFMGTFVSKDIVAQAMRAASLSKKDWGTHSPRKGGATYCSSGTTDGPTMFGLYNRGGWSLGLVTGRYIKFEPAEDQKIGRIIAGLPWMSGNFAILPPFFMGDFGDAVAEAIAMCFPNAPEELASVLPFCLASLVYHADWLMERLSPAHPLRSTPIFRPEILNRLKPFIVCRRYQEGDPIRPTGISPSSSIITGLEDMKEQLQAERMELLRSHEKQTEIVIATITKLLEDRAVGMNTVTFEGLNNALRAMTQPFSEKLDQLERLVRERQPQAVDTAPNTSNNTYENPQ